MQKVAPPPLPASPKTIRRPGKEFRVIELWCTCVLVCSRYGKLRHSGFPAEPLTHRDVLAGEVRIPVR